MTKNELNSLLTANAAYNMDLKKYMQGKLPTWKILDLGMPCGELSKHIDNTASILMPQRILTKAQKGHDATISLKQLEDLPVKLNHALAIFQSKKVDSVVVMVNEKDSKNNPVVVPINRRGVVFDGKKNKVANLITSIHGRPQKHLDFWTENGLNLYSKEKTFIHSEQPGAIPSVETNKGLKSATNVSQKSETTKFFVEKMADLTKKNT
ncbi:MAG: hypothetical protein LBG47_06640 [Prevotellaceae bacterium]|jgi:hypothetical protein|nr:hypothetical protein [Prevotellaceae bacterium]